MISLSGHSITWSMRGIVIISQAEAGHRLCISSSLAYTSSLVSSPRSPPHRRWGPKSRHHQSPAAPLPPQIPPSISGGSWCGHEQRRAMGKFSKIRAWDTISLSLKMAFTIVSQAYS